MVRRHQTKDKYNGFAVVLLPLTFDYSGVLPFVVVLSHPRIPLRRDERGGSRPLILQQAKP